MDIKWKKYSHSLTAKIIAFLITILCFSIFLTIFLTTAGTYQGDFDIVFEDSYFTGRDYIQDTERITEYLKELILEYKSEQNILNGATITEDEIKREEEQLFSEFRSTSKDYHYSFTNRENYNEFMEAYGEELTQIRDKIIQEDLQAYKSLLTRLDDYEGLVYYVGDGENEFTNSPNIAKSYFKAFPSYLIYDEAEQRVYPKEIRENRRYHWITANITQLINRPDTKKNALYIAFEEDYLKSKIYQWQEKKRQVTDSLYRMAGLLVGLFAAFIYLIFVIGRKPSENTEVHLNIIDKLYNDINLLLCFALIGSWIGIISYVFNNEFFEAIFPITLLIATLGLILVLSLVKHLKNRSFIKHTLTYTIFYKLFRFFKDIYNSGSVGVKIVLVVIGYPIIVALTFFMFPITIGIGVWLALKKVKEFNAVKEGVEKVKEGDIYHKINVSGNGEFGKLASDINSITEGLNKAVANELKSEKLKTELITNVSHDIRTPLTSIITYVDLLKNETDQTKAEEYLEIIDQKSQRLKMLTEDLFEASKASSGNIPVNYETIDIVSLITQGLGELDDKVQGSKLEFKINNPKDKVYIKADGKLLWRAIENLLDNIFKYALSGSRVYIDFEDLGTEIMLVIKNISAYELNISSEELMERFKRGDESRSSQGSGLGLSIAKSLIEIQKGSFNIEIDGDLFKAIIKMSK